ncbi:hypothetical protein [Nocardia flavorosea]|uniref:Uncharacterized protein n=1 Tax=Nocardia flavorosea TaxID=53429 RepID=A0A846YPX0_9NOCA|nr:hypothetical protein [Nocardia flavorosea]NKY60813.1 hypothetical protein [Nocardia flavorosea]
MQGLAEPGTTVRLRRGFGEGLTELGTALVTTGGREGHNYSLVIGVGTSWAQRRVPLSASVARGNPTMAWVRGVV